MQRDTRQHYYIKSVCMCVSGSVHGRSLKTGRHEITRLCSLLLGPHALSVRVERARCYCASRCVKCPATFVVVLTPPPLCVCWMTSSVAMLNTEIFSIIYVQCIKPLVAMLSIVNHFYLYIFKSINSYLYGNATTLSSPPPPPLPCCRALGLACQLT